MILGKPAVGAVALGSTGSSSSRVISLFPVAANITVSAHPSVAVVRDSPVAANITVSAHPSTFPLSGFTRPDAALVQVGSFGGKLSAAAPPSSTQVSVTVGHSVASVVSSPPVVVVEVVATANGFLVGNSPLAAGVLASVGAPTQAGSVEVTPASITVTARGFAIGAISEMAQARILVGTNVPVAASTSVPIGVDIAVLAQGTAGAVGQVIHGANVVAAGGNPVSTASTQSGRAEITVSGKGPVQGVVVSIVGAQVSVVGVAPVDGTTQTLPGVVIAVRGAPPITGLHSQPEATAVVVAAGVPSAGAVSKPSVAPVWVRANARTTVGDISQNFVVVLNANTLAASEYSIPAVDVVEHDNEVYYIQGDGIIRLSESGDEVFTSEVQTGQVDFGQTIGKRCPFVSLITGTDTTPEVYLIDDALVEYPTAIKQGHTDKYTRTYNSPRGVLTTRLGFKIRGPNLDFTLIDPEIVASANR